jgi:hypothetical protein
MVAPHFDPRDAERRYRLNRFLREHGAKGGEWTRELWWSFISFYPLLGVSAALALVCLSAGAFALQRFTPPLPLPQVMLTSISGRDSSAKLPLPFWDIFLREHAAIPIAALHATSAASCPAGYQRLNFSAPGWLASHQRSPTAFAFRASLLPRRHCQERAGGRGAAAPSMLETRYADLLAPASTRS